MQFGITLPHFRQVASPDALRNVAARAEHMGFDSIWVTDHVALPQAAVQRFGAVFYEPLTVLSYVAAVTSKIKIGTSAIILPYRNPLVTAKQLATVDVLSGGRLIFGAASGWAEDEFKALGVSFQDRGARSDEYLQATKVLWTQESPEFHGKFVDFKGIHFKPKPIQKPHPPIWIGGNSRRGIRRAVEFGNCWHPTRPTVKDVQAGKAHLEKVARRIGRNPNEIAIAAREPLKVIETIPADPNKPTVGPKSHILDSFRQFREAGVSHVVIDLFYSIPELNEETLESVLRSMDFIINDIRSKT